MDFVAKCHIPAFSVALFCGFWCWGWSPKAYQGFPTVPLQTLLSCFSPCILLPPAGVLGIRAWCLQLIVNSGREF